MVLKRLGSFLKKEFKAAWDITLSSPSFVKLNYLHDRYVSSGNLKQYRKMRGRGVEERLKYLICKSNKYSATFSSNTY